MGCGPALSVVGHRSGVQRHRFSAEQRSIDILSTDFDSSTEGSVGDMSRLWESSDKDDVSGDESSDNSTQYSGSL